VFGLTIQTTFSVLGYGKTSKMPDAKLLLDGGGHGKATSGTNDDSTSSDREKTRSLLLREANYDVEKVKSSKRSSYLSWDDYFMAVAFLSAQRSKDPHARAGACIVHSDNFHILGIGYNGFPKGCSDDILPWAQEAEEKLHTKHPYECQAEVNAVLNKCSADVVGAKMYVGLFPCNESTKVIIQSGIREVVYLHDPKIDSDSYRASRIMLELAGVAFRQYLPTKQTIHLNFDPTRALPFNNPTSIQDNSSKHNNDTHLAIEQLLLREANYEITNFPVTSKRTNYLSWDDYFMAMAFLSAHRSKDPNTQVGACIVDAENRIIGLGYNGFPRGCEDDVLPWVRSGPTLHTKYPYVCHAEVNAIMNKCSASVVGAKIYVALFPCNNCAKMIIQSGIKEVVFLSNKYHDTDQCKASRIMFQMSKVKVTQYRPRMQQILISFSNHS